LRSRRALRGAPKSSRYRTTTRSWGDDWDIEALPMAITVKVLAVADAFGNAADATCGTAGVHALERVGRGRKGAEKTFAREAVRALRVVAGRLKRCA